MSRLIISVWVHVFLSSSQCSECLRVLSMGNSLVNVARGQKGQIWTCGLVIANSHTLFGNVQLPWMDIIYTSCFIIENNLIWHNIYYFDFRLNMYICTWTMYKKSKDINVNKNSFHTSSSVQKLVKMKQARKKATIYVQDTTKWYEFPTLLYLPVI